MTAPEGASLQAVPIIVEASISLPNDRPPNLPSDTTTCCRVCRPWTCAKEARRRSPRLQYHPISRWFGLHRRSKAAVTRCTWVVLGHLPASECRPGSGAAAQPAAVLQCRERCSLGAAMQPTSASALGSSRRFRCNRAALDKLCSQHALGVSGLRRVFKPFRHICTDDFMMPRCLGRRTGAP